jgi:hypothetical protein
MVIRVKGAGEGQVRAYDRSVVVHFGEELFERGIFARREFGLRGGCDGVGLFFCIAVGSRDERGCRIG